MKKTYMMNKLQIHDPIDKKTLDPAHYFQSFLVKAARHGLLENTEEIRRATLQLAMKMAQRYVFGASSSLTAEAAQGLLESAMYCIGRRLKAMQTGEALKLLKTLPIEQIWNEGKDLLRSDCGRARRLLGSLQDSPFKTENMAYSGTLFEALPAFFAAYDIDYAAHDTPCLIDYPLCEPPDELTGAEYILEYLRRLSIENSFCGKYTEQIEPLLRGYSPFWRDLNINIFELALTNAVGRALCGKYSAGLGISAEDRETLQYQLKDMSAVRLKVLICVAIRRISPETEFPKAVREYMLKAAEQIAPRIRNALETGSLESVFITLKDRDPKFIRFKDSAAMDDEAFRIVTGEIRSCRHITDKIALIKQEIRSVADLADMLAASCLDGNEYGELFNTLDEDTLALLCVRLPEDGAMHVTEKENEWHAAFLKYLKNSGKEARIMEAAKNIEL